MVVDEVVFLAREKLLLCRRNTTSLYFPLIVAGDGRGHIFVGGGAVVGCW